MVDLVNQRALILEHKLVNAEKKALEELKYKADELNGDGIIGVSINHNIYSLDRDGIHVTGTVVKLKEK